MDKKATQESSNLGASTIERLGEIIADSILEDYNISPADSRRIAFEVVSKSKALSHLCAVPSATIKSLLRTKAFLEARKEARKTAYYTLRQYKRGAGGAPNLASLVGQIATFDNPIEQAHEVLRSHASTNERIRHASAFQTALLPWVESAAEVIDVGCGLFPLMYPWGSVPFLKNYWALDRDTSVIEALEVFARGAAEARLHPRRWCLSDGWSNIAVASKDNTVALLFKLVPVVARQEHQLIPLLCDVPASRLIVTGSEFSLTKRVNIRRREEALIRSFADRAQCSVVGGFSIENEFALVIER